MLLKDFEPGDGTRYTVLAEDEYFAVGSGGTIRFGYWINADTANSIVTELMLNGVVGALKCDEMLYYREKTETNPWTILAGVVFYWMTQVLDFRTDDYRTVARNLYRRAKRIDRWNRVKGTEVKYYEVV